MVKADSKSLAPFVILFSIAALSVYLSDAEARLNVDSHHWGIIFSNAADLANGRTPFRETYEIYGLFSSMLNAIIFLLIEPRLVILGHVASFFYVINLIFSYIIARKFLGEWFALFVPLFMFLLHPYVVYPWPNYPSYAFLLGGIYFVLRETRGAFLAAGILFGLSILTRHGMVLTIFPLIILVVLLKLWQQRVTGNKHAGSVFQLLLGTFVPIAIFLMFLLSSDLLEDWYRLTFTVSSQFVEMWQEEFGYSSRIDFVLPFLKTVYLNTSSTRGIFLTLMAWSVTGYAITSTIKPIRRGWPHDEEAACILVACTVLFGFAQGAHTMGIFRWVNASSLGIIFLVLAIQALSRGLVPKHSSAAAFAVLLTLAGLLSTNLLSNRELQGQLAKRNIWDKNFYKRISTPYHGSVRILHGKTWGRRQIDPLEEVQNALERAKSCGLSVIVNTTKNPLLPYLVEGLQKPQREPCRVPRRLSDQIFSDEVRTRQELLSRGEAILAAGPQTEIPNHYTVLFQGSIPFQTGQIAVAVPSSCLDKGSERPATSR